MHRKILVTSALPYANGSIHLGHMLEHIQTDIWARFQRICGHQCISICAEDAHGTPVMLKAKALGISPEQLAEQSRHEHSMDLQDFGVEYDNFYITHSNENRELCEEIYNNLNASGYIIKRNISQLYDPVSNIFLPDRFVKGRCPKCASEDQYGDTCDNCGATYSAAELQFPRSVISGSVPELRDSEHFFFDLPRHEEAVKRWFKESQLQEEIVNKLNEWFDQGLQQWDISRDEPYFGFKIPGTDDKYFYVWVDAPVGYMSCFKNYCQKKDIVFEDFWGLDSKAEVHHFIGKDIIYFHCLFWPAILHGAGYRKPTNVHVHGFVTINGVKMSKSRGTFIKARTYLEHLNPEYLRYYYASKLNNGVTDIDLNFEDFVKKVNSDLVGKVVNIASRCASFLTKKYQGSLSKKIVEPILLESFISRSECIANFYETKEYAKAVKEIMILADKANQYITNEAPWIAIKDNDKQNFVHEVCSMGIHMFRIIIIYLSPILPELAKKAEKFLNDRFSWRSVDIVLTSHRINNFEVMIHRIDANKVEKILESSKDSIGK